MKRSKNQAVFKFLPEMWVSEKNDSNMAVTARIKNWNYIEMKGIYEEFVEGEIKRQIKLFGNRGGDIASFDVEETNRSFTIVEPACNEGVPDIIGEISPLVFYCSICGSSFEERNASRVDYNTRKCRNPQCQKLAVKQLQMIYACECGYAQPIRIPYVRTTRDLRYRPNENPYKMFYKENGVERTAEFTVICPSCNHRLVPDNASSGRNYKPFNIKVINLVDDRSGAFYKKGIKAQKIVVAKWFEKLTNAEYDNILEDVAAAFSKQFSTDSKKKEIEDQVRNLVAANMIPESSFQMFVDQLLSKCMTERNVDTFERECDNIFAYTKSTNELLYNEWLNHFSFKLMQYNTLKYAKNKISLQDSIEAQLEMEFIDDENAIPKFCYKLGIANVQISSDIQILNCTYGYTRRLADPKNSNNKNCRLKLNSYDKAKDGSTNLVFSAKLDTEGLLFEIDQRKIVEWLFSNNIISEAQVPDLDSSLAIKKWFADNVHGDVITMFGDIDVSETITKHVFGLLHSMAHSFMKTAGEISGLAGTSLSEIIIVETASIFIYAQSSQGIPLGALSGMFESSFYYFLTKTYSDSKNCIFDPVCSERDDTACTACLIIPEVSCNHFNVELGRKYLYSIPGCQDITKGFWEM